MTAFLGTGLAWSAMMSASLMVAIGTMRLVSQPHARNRGSTRTIVVPFQPGWAATAE